jgi:very-short-patch-repair endonuclease
MKRNPEWEQCLAAQLEHCGCLPPVMEFRFAPGRGFRFDLAWVARKIAVEIDGAVWSRGRHVRPLGYMRDQEKNNIAMRLGWRVLHYTPDKVRNWTAAQEIASVLLGRDVVIG